MVVKDTKGKVLSVGDAVSYAVVTDSTTTGKRTRTYIREGVITKIADAVISFEGARRVTGDIISDDLIVFPNIRKEEAA